MQVRFLSGLLTRGGNKAAVFQLLCVMFYAYVIRSIHTGYLYKGHCENLKIRITQHNAGMTESIRPYIPFELVYWEEFETRGEAIKREKYFKTAAGRRFLKKKLDNRSSDFSEE